MIRAAMKRLMAWSDPFLALPLVHGALTAGILAVFGPPALAVALARVARGVPLDPPHRGDHDRP